MPRLLRLLRKFGRMVGGATIKKIGLKKPIFLIVAPKRTYCEAPKAASEVIYSNEFSFCMMKNKVYILFAKISPTFDQKKFESYHTALPSFLSNKVDNYKNYKDQLLGILGKHLLLRCLKKLNLPERLSSYAYKENKRPFLKEFPTLDFNISHSGDFVLCAACLNMRLGIDIEQQKQVQLINFKHQFSKKEWQTLQEPTAWKELFFQYWTKKESVTKTDGSGISIDFSTVEVLQSRIYYEKNFWLFTPLTIHSNYSACLASNEIPFIHLEEVFF